MRILKSRPDRKVAVLECSAWLYEGSKGLACGAVVEFERGDIQPPEHSSGSDFVQCPCCGSRTYSRDLRWKKAAEQDVR